MLAELIDGHKTATLDLLQVYPCFNTMHIPTNISICVTTLQDVSYKLSFKTGATTNTIKLQYQDIIMSHIDLVGYRLILCKHTLSSSHFNLFKKKVF